MRFARSVTTAIALATLAAGCANHAVTKRGSVAPTDGVSTSTVVTAQELGRLTTRGSIMDALQRLRPFMLSSRGATPLVSVDGSPPAELSLLRMIPTSDVREVRLLRSSASVGHPVIAPNGDVIVGDVIAVTTWRGGRTGR